MSRYNLVIKANSAAKALEIAKSIPDFKLDESYKPVALKGGFVVRGEGPQSLRRLLAFQRIPTVRSHPPITEDKSE